MMVLRAASVLRRVGRHDVGWVRALVGLRIALRNETSARAY
jgi:hypothetical protein